MVSKVAVIAIVGILAVPILLGYALNLEQTTETDYQTTGDSVNVTQLLQSGTDYTYANADVYQLNTNFEEFSVKCIPVYQSVSSNRTSYKMNVATSTITPGSYIVGNYNNIISTYYIYFGENSNITFIDLEGGSIEHTKVYNVIALYYDPITNEGKIVRPGGNITTFTPYDLSDYLYFRNDGTSDRSYYVARDLISGNQYVDLSAGYTFNFAYVGPLFLGENYDNAVVKFPNYTKNALITIDLDSITDANYSFGIGTQCYIEKTTTNGVVSWQVKPRPRISDNVVPVTDLYYDPNSSNNTYQIKIWVDPNGEPSTIIPGYNEYIQHYEFRYIGNWPSLIGEANYYQSFDVQAKLFALTPNFNNVIFGGFSAKSPIMRIDAAEYRAMEYQVIADKTYNPSAFKTNPATTINDPVVYGPSFTFGGITYAVKKGNITMGSHDIPVKGLVLSSVPHEGGGYDNKIGNTVISTTAYPSTITFNGKWSASISTIAQEGYQVTKTEWKAGSFAWDGMDQNFLMVGLLASLGAFIALGIYARRSRATIWPLMIVCGGAALLFFIML